MKKFVILIPALALAFSLFQPSYAVPPKWNSPYGKNYIKTFLSDCNPKNDPVMKKYCDCVLNKIQATYPDPKYVRRLSKKSMDILGLSCLSWDNDAGKKFSEGFLSECNRKKDPVMKSYCECVLQKIKEKYPNPSGTQKITSKEIEALSKKCIEEMK